MTPRSDVDMWTRSTCPSLPVPQKMQIPPSLRAERVSSAAGHPHVDGVHMSTCVGGAR